MSLRAISASLRLRATHLLAKKCQCGGEPWATLYPIWPAGNLNLRLPAPETNTLPLDQLALEFQNVITVISILNPYEYFHYNFNPNVIMIFSRTLSISKLKNTMINIFVALLSSCTKNLNLVLWSTGNVWRIKLEFRAKKMNNRQSGVIKAFWIRKKASPWKNPQKTRSEKSIGDAIVSYGKNPRVTPKFLLEKIRWWRRSIFCGAE